MVGQWAQALKESKPQKTPGPGSFSVFYWKTFTHILAQLFTQGYNSILDGGPFPADNLHATITVIP